MHVQNIINQNGNTVPNQFVITRGNTTTFQSYDTEIISINRKTKKIIVNIDGYGYSVTTNRHTNNFLKMFFGNTFISELKYYIKKGYKTLDGYTISYYRKGVN